MNDTDPNPELRSAAQFESCVQACLKRTGDLAPILGPEHFSEIRINPVTWKRILEDAGCGPPQAEEIPTILDAGCMGLWYLIPVRPMEGAGVALRLR